MPAVELEPTGGVHRLLLQSPHSIVEAPAGNGDLFETLQRAGIVEQLHSRGVAQLQVQICLLSGSRVQDMGSGVQVSGSEVYDLGVRVQAQSNRFRV